MTSRLDGDPLEQHFDRGVGLVAYALLFASIFFLGVPGIVAAAMAFAHKRGPDPLMDSHFRFQLQIFWTYVGLFVLGFLGIVGAAITGVSHFWSPGWHWWTNGTNVSISYPSAAPLGWTALVVGVILVLTSAAWSLGASAYGFLKLIGGRPIGRALA